MACPRCPRCEMTAAVRAEVPLTRQGPARDEPPFRLAGRPELEEVAQMALSLNIGRCTEVGNYRENNEDSIDVKVFPDMTVCLVADGMGGQAAGEVASKRAIEIIPRELKKHITGIVGSEEIKTIIRKAILQANEEIIAMAALDRELKNMGTTVVMSVWRKGSAAMYVTGLGDSRTYRVRRGKIEQLTVDHS